MEDAMNVHGVGIVGCGLMGAGLVEVVALAGFRVVAVKATAGSVQTAAARVEESMGRAVTKGKLDAAARDAARERMTFTDDFEALRRCDLVIECTAESLTGKKRMLAEIERSMRKDAILATNTSSLPLADLAAALERPGRFLGLHFFSPVQAMKLVEIAPLRPCDGSLSETRDDVTAEATAFVEAIGKSPVPVQGEPGYVVNRLLVPYLCQAIEMLESGVAGAREIDAAMKLGCGHPLGPLALSDLIGLDVVFAMTQSLSAELHDRRFRAPTLLRRLVLSGQVGKKVKVGLYDYRGAEPIENPEVRQSVHALSA
jgi:3-hydroxybutyryl-CoA dehydrogenase